MDIPQNSDSSRPQASSRGRRGRGRGGRNRGNQKAHITKQTAQATQATQTTPPTNGETSTNSNQPDKSKQTRNSKPNRRFNGSLTQFNSESQSPLPIPIVETTGEEDLRTRLERELKTGKVECLICFEVVKTYDVSCAPTLQLVTDGIQSENTLVQYLLQRLPLEMYIGMGKGVLQPTVQRRRGKALEMSRMPNQVYKNTSRISLFLQKTARPKTGKIGSPSLMRSILFPEKTALQASLSTSLSSWSLYGLPDSNLREMSLQQDFYTNQVFLCDKKS